MAVQYDKETNSTITWIGQIKNALKGISAEADKTFKQLSQLDDIDFNKLRENNFKDFIAENELADKSLVKFLEDVNYEKKTLESYQQYLKDTGKSTTTFASLTKGAKTAIKSLGAALASMAVNFLIIKGIETFIKLLDNLIVTADEARESSEALTKAMSDFREEIKNGNKTLSSVVI